MSPREDDIVHENGSYWVLRRVRANGYVVFEVYKTGLTHSVRCDEVGGGLASAREIAIAKCNRRAESQ